MALGRDRRQGSARGSHAPKSLRGSFESEPHIRVTCERRARFQTRIPPREESIFPYLSRAIRPSGSSFRQLPEPRGEPREGNTVAQEATRE